MGEEIERELRQYVIDNLLYGENSDALSNNDSFLEKGLFDSMGIVTLVGYVQKKYKITVPHCEVIPENWDSVSRLAGYVRRKTKVHS